MPQFLIAVHHPVQARERPAEEMNAIIADVSALNAQAMSDGTFVFAGGLHPPDRSKSVVTRDGKVVVTDGPYIETKEYMGGFWVIDVADMQAALAWASQAALACRESLEVREFMLQPPSGS